MRRRAWIMRIRDITSGVGRFLTVDAGPANPGNPTSWNRYGYTWGDPVNLNDADGRLPSNVESGSFGCVSTGYYVPAGAVDASNPCSPGSTPGGSGSWSSKTKLQQIAGIFHSLSGIVDDWDYAGSGFGLSFTNTATMQVATGLCLAQPEFCVAGAVDVTIYVAWPHLRQLAATLASRLRAQRDPAQVRSIPAEVAGTTDPDGDCEPPAPDQKGPEGLTYKWQQTSSNPNNKNPTPHWHFTKWNLNPSDCTWRYAGPGESATDPGPGYKLIPGMF